MPRSTHCARCRTALGDNNDQALTKSSAEIEDKGNRSGPKGDGSAPYFFCSARDQNLGFRFALR